MRGSYDLVVSSDINEIGREVSPGNWTGVIGYLARGEADIFAGIYAGNPKVYQFAPFTASVGSATFRILSGPPAQLHQRPESLLTSVSPELWAYLGVSWVLQSVIYWWIARKENFIFRRMQDNISLVESLLTFYGLLFQKGFDNLPSNLSGRLAVTGWLFLVIVIMTFLGGTLSSKLAVVDYPERIDSVSDILKYPNLKPYTPDGLAGVHYIKTTGSMEMTALYKQMVRLNTICSIKKLFSPELMAEIDVGDAVIISTPETLFPLVVGEACKKKLRPFYVGKDSFLNIPFVTLHRTGLPTSVVEKLNNAISQLVAMGFHHKIGKWRHADPCMSDTIKQTTYSSSGIKPFSKVFEILSIGLLAGLIVIVFENLVYLHKRYYKWKTAD